MPPKKKIQKKRRSPVLAILFGIFLVMLAIVFLSDRSADFENREKNEKFFPTFDQNSVSRIEIQKPKSEMVKLARVDDKWIVESKGNYAADDSLIESAFNIFSSLRGGTLVSKNPEKQEEMGISDTAGLRVKFFQQDGAPVLDFFLGNRGPILQSQYVRLADLPEVYLFSESLDFYFDKAEWRNKNILGLLSDDISEFAIKSPTGKISYVKSDGAWQMRQENGTLSAVSDVENVKRLAVNIGNLSALSFADNDEANTIDFEALSDAVKLWVKTRQGAVYVVFFVKENDTIYAKRTDSPMVFTVSETTYEELLSAL